MSELPNQKGRIHLPSRDDCLTDAAASSGSRPQETASSASPESSPAKKSKNAAGKNKQTLQSSKEDKMATSSAS